MCKKKVSISHVFSVHFQFNELGNVQIIDIRQNWIKQTGLGYNNIKMKCTGTDPNSYQTDVKWRLLFFNVKKKKKK